MRNLTYDQLLEWQKQRRDAEVSAVPEYETVVTHTLKLDPKSGKPVVDSDGVPTLVEKRLLKRAVIAAEWADKLKPYEEQAHDRY